MKSERPDRREQARLRSRLAIEAARNRPPKAPPVSPRPSSAQKANGDSGPQTPASVADQNVIQQPDAPGNAVQESVRIELWLEIVNIPSQNAYWSHPLKQNPAGIVRLITMLNAAEWPVRGALLSKNYRMLRWLFALSLLECCGMRRSNRVFGPVSAFLRNLVRATWRWSDSYSMFALALSRHSITKPIEDAPIYGAEAVQNRYFPIGRFSVLAEKLTGDSASTVLPSGDTESLRQWPEIQNGSNDI